MRPPKPGDLPPLCFCGGWGAIEDYEVVNPAPALPMPPTAARPIDCDGLALELAFRECFPEPPRPPVTERPACFDRGKVQAFKYYLLVLLANGRHAEARDTSPSCNFGGTRLWVTVRRAPC